ncbi:hypothetical protein Agub_g9133, partial [Astrephomene gubernaculifera]
MVPAFEESLAPGLDVIHRVGRAASSGSAVKLLSAGYSLDQQRKAVGTFDTEALREEDENGLVLTAAQSPAAALRARSSMSLTSNSCTSSSCEESTPSSSGDTLSERSLTTECNVATQGDTTAIIGTLHTCSPCTATAFAAAATDSPESVDSAPLEHAAPVTDAMPAAAAASTASTAMSSLGKETDELSGVPNGFHPEDVQLARMLTAAAQAVSISPVQLLETLLNFTPEECQDLASVVVDSGCSCVQLLAYHLHNLRVMEEVAQVGTAAHAGSVSSGGSNKQTADSDEESEQAATDTHAGSDSSECGEAAPAPAGAAAAAAAAADAQETPEVKAAFREVSFSSMQGQHRQAAMRLVSLALDLMQARQAQTPPTTIRGPPAPPPPPGIRNKNRHAVALAVGNILGLDAGAPTGVGNLRHMTVDALLPLASDILGLQDPGAAQLPPQQQQPQQTAAATRHSSTAAVLGARPAATAASSSALGGRAALEAAVQQLTGASLADITQALAASGLGATATNPPAATSASSADQTALAAALALAGRGGVVTAPSVHGRAASASSAAGLTLVPPGALLEGAGTPRMRHASVGSRVAAAAQPLQQVQIPLATQQVPGAGMVAFLPRLQQHQPQPLLQVQMQQPRLLSTQQYLPGAAAAVPRGYPQVGLDPLRANAIVAQQIYNQGQQQRRQLQQQLQQQQLQQQQQQLLQQQLQLIELLTAANNAGVDSAGMGASLGALQVTDMSLLGSSAQLAQRQQLAQQQQMVQQQELLRLAAGG